MNIGLHVSLQILVFIEYLPRIGISVPYGVCIFSFLRSIHTAHMAASIYFATGSGKQYKRVLFSPTASSTFIVSEFSDDGHCDQCEVIPHCSFDLHFSNN